MFLTLDVEKLWSSSNFEDFKESTKFIFVFLFLCLVEEQPSERIETKGNLEEMLEPSDGSPSRRLVIVRGVGGGGQRSGWGLRLGGLQRCDGGKKKNLPSAQLAFLNQRLLVLERLHPDTPSLSAAGSATDSTTFVKL